MMDGGFIFHCVVPACEYSCNGCMAGEMLLYSVCWVVDFALILLVAGVFLILVSGLMAWIKQRYTTKHFKKAR